MLRVETLVIVILYSVKIKSTGIAFSTDAAEFENAKTLCSSDYQVAGTNFFNRCQPKNCGKIDLKGHEINVSMVDDTTQIVWIGAYVVRSPVMEYKGCYKVKLPSKTIQQLDQNLNDTDNDVLKCSRFCKSTGGGQRGYVILLQGFKCYCAKKSLGEWTSLGQVVEVSTSECSKDCPGDEIDWCGGTDIKIVAAYEFKGDKNEDEDIHLGKKCFYTAPNRRAPSTLMPGNCFQKLKFKCQMVDISGSGGSKNVLTKRCYQILLNWYDAQLKCLQEKSYLPTYTPSSHICISEEDVDEENNWHNAFLKERIVWETEKKPRFNHKCLAIEFKKDGNFTYLALNCTDKYRAFCIKKATTETTTHSDAQQETTYTTYAAKTTTYSNAQQETSNTKYAAKITTGFVTVSSNRLPRAVDMHNPSSNHSKVELYIAVPLTVAVLIVSIIITVICIKRRRKRKTNENENEENMSAVYYSTVPDEVTLKRDSDLPLADANGACLVNETDVYNHLGDTDQQNHSDVTGPVYDHTGLQDNDQYDISVISEKRTNKDGDDLNHYDLMQVGAEISSVYDETSTERKTNGDKSIDSVDIYDHAKQTESDYDTTDTQKQHEQREHVHEPTYDQSGSCENLREPTYDQSGPCEHLTDPMYDQSDSLGADIYEKCETKQSTIDEQ
ncbi:uncharacterized protein LOC134724512 isoform X2 [Mytilus trossulus]|uniref:uncharacterized protein LOC134724512 isoform X2 n=1 Tax=Mytilus trossulus TaxID=6551 RepID=UPI003005C206